MSAPNTEEVNTSTTGDETHGLGSREIEDVSYAASSLSAPLTSEEVATQIKDAFNPLTKHLEMLCDLIKELKRTPQEIVKKLLA